MENDKALVRVQPDGEDADMENITPASPQRIDEPQQNRDLWSFWIVVVGMAAALFIGSFLLNHYGIASASEARNVVTEFPAVSTRFGTPSFQAALQTLKSLPSKQRSAFLDKNFPSLHEDVVYYLRDRGKLTASDRILRVQFLFGSVENAKAEDGDGNINEGKFEDQLIARISVTGKDKSLDVIVFCLNGTFELPEDLQVLGSRVPEQQFIIAAGEGLTSHVAMPTAVDLAKRFNLPMYRGKKIAEQFRITPEEAQQIDTDKTQVTVYVVEGDQFDLINMTFQPSSKRPSR